MTKFAITRKRRAIAHVRAYFPDSYLIITPPGAVIVESLVNLMPLWYHDPAAHGPHHRAWTRMAFDMRKRGLI